MKLHELQENQRAYITDLVSDKVPLKLIEMGFLPGNSVEVLHWAPLKDPMYLKINGTYISIRKDVAQWVEVQLMA